MNRFVVLHFLFCVVNSAPFPHRKSQPTRPTFHPAPVFSCSTSHIRHHALPSQWDKPCRSPEVGTKPGGGEGQTRLFAISAATLHRLRVGIVHIFVVSKAGSAANGWEGARPRTNKVANTAWNNTTSRATARPRAKRNPGKTRRLTSAKVDAGAPSWMKTSPQRMHSAKK